MSAWQRPSGCGVTGHFSLNIPYWEIDVLISKRLSASHGIQARGMGNVPPRAIPLQPSSVECIYSSFPKALLALLWFCLFLVPAGIQTGKLRTYQSISVVKRNLSAGCAAGISQVGVGVVDRESAQTWQGEKDAAEVVCWWRMESRNAAMDTTGGSGSVSFWGSGLHQGTGRQCTGNASAVGTPAGMGQYGSLLPATVLPKSCSGAQVLLLGTLLASLP